MTIIPFAGVRLLTFYGARAIISDVVIARNLRVRNTHG